MALPPNFLDELRARTPMAPLVARKVRLVKSGRNHKGNCPFHNEKTPSFYVYEDGFHCFGCGAHGDAITFVMRTEGASFIEAVERLAAEAGLDVPKPSPAEAAREARARDLYGVMEAAAEAFQRRLRLPEGRPALDYLLRRGLTEATIAKFGLGWAGQGRGSLAADLKPLDITTEQLLEAGLLREPREPGETPPELFFSRVMFPIRDRRGRLIAFGGRILGDGQPKYVNSPETPLFSKRRSLYALDLAREAAFGGAAVVAVEGYMDVIALHQAGFEGAVAPLGTALTQEQFEELWRLTPEPVLCFDGDAAGARAAARAAETALPLLSPERTLRLATLPAGEDPDTLVQRGGPHAFKAVLAAARPLGEALYDLLGEGRPASTPEQRAAFRNRLVEAAGRIPDRALAAEYRRLLLDRFFASGRLRGTKPPSRHAARPLLDVAVSAEARARCLLAIALAHPWILAQAEEALAAIDLPTGPARQLGNALLAWLPGAATLDSATLADHLRSTGDLAALEWVNRSTGLPAAARGDAQPAEALEGWWHFFNLLRGEAALVEDHAAARRDWVATNDAGAFGRMLRLKEALDALRRGESEAADAGGASEAGAASP